MEDFKQYLKNLMHIKVFRARRIENLLKGLFYQQSIRRHYQVLRFTQTEVLVPLSTSFVSEKAKVKAFKSIFKILLNHLSNTLFDKPPLLENFYMS